MNISLDDGINAGTLADNREQRRRMARRQVQKESPKTRFELRFDSEVYDGVERLADQVGISLNQLMQGISRWAIANANPGEYVGDQLSHEDGSPVVTKDQPGVVWFGDDFPVFELDFTERRVVRELDQGRKEKSHERKRK